MQRKLLDIINVEFDATCQLLIIYSAYIKYFRKNEIQESSTSAPYKVQESLSFIVIQVLYNILIEFGIPMKLVRLIKMCLKHMADSG